MARPVVAIVGRPNVGKSTLFNRLVGKRLAIVEDTPGVTRDRLYSPASWGNREFIITDTGGIIMGDQDPMRESILSQAQIAMTEAEVVILVADVRDGLTAADHDLADFLRRSKTPVLVAVNKADDQNWSYSAAEFHAMGFEEVYAISAHHGHGVADLLDSVIEKLPDSIPEPVYDEGTVRLAVVGRPNVGKSSLINAILGENRVIVSDVAGTTRDAIDTPFKFQDRELVFIDTAGIRRAGKVQGSIEYYSVLRATRAMERSDVAILVLDASQGLLDGDKRVGGYTRDAKCACVIVVNKWDLQEDRSSARRSEIEKKIREALPYLSYAPIVFASALRKEGMDAIIDSAMVAYDNFTRRIPTGQLNRSIHDWMDARPLVRKGRELKVYYATIGEVSPPTITLFVNDPELMHFSYLRYLDNQLRKTYGFAGTPVFLRVRRAGGELDPITKSSSKKNA